MPVIALEVSRVAAFLTRHPPAPKPADEPGRALCEPLQ